MNEQPILRPRVAGKFRLTATKPDGSTRVLADWFDNLILDAGLNRIGTNGIFGQCQVGSGSTAPTVANTALQILVASTSSEIVSSTGVQPSAPYYGSCQKTYRFATGVAAGNISEVGVGWDTVNGLFSRALIKDALGDPTTITVLSDETLDVSYELRVYPPLTDAIFQATVGGVVHDCVMRAAGVSGSPWAPNYLPLYGAIFGYSVTAYDGPLGSITQLPSGTTAVATVAMATYSNNSNKSTAEAVFALGSANFTGGISAILVQTQYAGSYQISFSPNIAKIDTQILRLNTEVSWARYTP